MTNRYGLVDVWIDDVRFPHRTLVNSEMYTLFTVISEAVDGHYLREEHDAQAAVVAAEEALETAKKALAENPRYQEVLEECRRLSRVKADDLSTPEAEKAHSEAICAAFGERQALEAPPRQAEEALSEAQARLNHLGGEMKDAERVLGYLAGKRDGFRLGVALAMKLAVNPAQDIAGVPDGRALLMMVAGMADDGVADALIGSIVAAAEPRTPSEAFPGRRR